LDSISIRVEASTDINVIDQLNRESFGGEDEPKLIKLLRERGELLLSIVAIKEKNIIGHVCATRVNVEGKDYSIAGIGPLAVTEHQRERGIGTMLMKKVIEQLRTDGYIAAVLLGNPNYYPRFGFIPGSKFDLQNEYGAGDSFMALELQDRALENIIGKVQYVSAFAECGA